MADVETAVPVEEAPATDAGSSKSSVKILGGGSKTVARTPVTVGEEGAAGAEEDSKVSPDEDQEFSPTAEDDSTAGLKRKLAFDEVLLQIYFPACLE